MGRLLGVAGFGPDDARSAGAGQGGGCGARADAAQVDTVDTPSTSRPARNVADCCGFPVNSGRVMVR